MPAGDLDGARRATRFYKDLLADLATLPGVSAAGATRTHAGNVGFERRLLGSIISPAS